MSEGMTEAEKRECVAYREGFGNGYDHARRTPAPEKDPRIKNVRVVMEGENARDSVALPFKGKAKQLTLTWRTPFPRSVWRRVLRWLLGRLECITIHVPATPTDEAQS